MTWTDPDDMDGALTGDVLPLAWWNAVMANFEFLYEAPQCAVRLTSTQEVANATDHTIEWDEVVWDSTGGTMWDAGSPSVVVIPRAGVYQISCFTLWDASTLATKRAIFLNATPSGGSSSRRRGVQVPAVNPSEIFLHVDTNLAVDDTIDFEVRQLSGDALDLQPTRTVATIRWVSAPPTAGE